MQVMGSLLRTAGERMELWDEALLKLVKAESMGKGKGRQLFERLQISYDALGEPEQRMFLDTATMFLNRRASTVKRAWKA